MPPQERARLVDVANRAQVAISTASRALGGSASVAAATVERVVSAATELGYETNPVAAGLKRGNTLNIGLVAVANYWYSGAVTAGADHVAAREGYDFVVMMSAGGNDGDLIVKRARRLGRRVDGALVLDLQNELATRVIDALGVPVVTLGCASPNVPSVLVDNLQVGANVAEYLSSLDHTRALVLAPENPSAFALDNSTIRQEGFVEAFPGVAERVRLPHDDLEERHRLLLDACQDNTAVFCATDELAIETIAVLRSHGYRVPEDCCVVGVDDHPLALPMGLTTIAQRPQEMGAKAAAMLLEQLNGGTSVASALMPTTLVARQSA